ncbi:MAG: hypothetical protein ACYCVX_14995, partial [Thiobacillus sp.]
MNKQVLKSKKSFWTMAVIVAAIIIFSSMVFAGCTTSATATTVAEETTTTQATTTSAAQEIVTTTANELKFKDETLVLTGSTTLLEVAQKWAEEFMKANGGKITVNGG